MPVIKLTKSRIESIPFTSSGQAFYIDSSLTGFCLRVGKNTKTFYAQKRINGKDKRISIGICGQITLDQARREAQRLLGMMATGKNPKEEEKQEEAAQITLLEVFNDYLKTRKALKPRTVDDYHKIMKAYFSNWHNVPMAEITKDMVAKKHAKLGERSHAQANYAMRVLRALFNFAKGQYEDDNGDSLFFKNPVERLSQTRGWYEVERRRTLLTADQLGPFIEAANKLENKIIRDYLLFLLFTGVRKQEGMNLKWEDVNLMTQTIKIADTKNKRPLLLPMSDFIYDMLEKRSRMPVNEYVFSGTGQTGHLVEPRKQMAKITEWSGVSFTLHDFRRTFITIAESLDISSYAVKHLVNHKMKNDVTAGYIVMDAGRLRKPMQKITDYILEKAGVKAVNNK